MRCRKCGEKAAINMRQHKLALCGTHFLDWIPEQTQRFIEKYRMFGEDSRILLAVSGGKDSLALWDVLQRLGYQTTGLYIGLGINEYSMRSQEMAEKFATENDLNLTVVDVADEEGATIPEASKLTERGKGKPCSVCGLTKRHMMNRVAREGGYDVVTTGHNLDDEVAVLFGNTLNWAVGYLARQGPVLEETAAGLVRKAKPFCRFYERETAAYTLLRGINYIYEECPYAEGATSIYHKELLNQMEEVRPGLKLSFYLSFLRAKESGLFVQESTLAKSKLAQCRTCGQPTTAPDQCAYCRTWDGVRKRRVTTREGETR
ncbi:MAG: adenine nucleotide alpha hydrolase family protein [Anaerolineaceae bacterium]|nr:MAG: adenine nucleotide alpha hydrolase family protein [Anaerolineaceae bacterium]